MSGSAILFAFKGCGVGCCGGGEIESFISIVLNE